MLNHRISVSGYPVYHVQMKDAVCCQVQIVANCGSAHEDDDSWGVAHFLEHMCFQGTPTKNKHQVSREQSMVGSYNAYTNEFTTVYHFDALNEDFEQGLTLLKEAVFDSCYPEQEFEKEKSVIIEEWRMYDNYPQEHFTDHILQTCFGVKEGHPVIGTEASINAMTPEKLHRFRNKWYGKNNIAIVVVGNLEFEKVMEAINRVVPPAPDVEQSPICWHELNAVDKSVMETDRFEQAAFGLVHKWPALAKSIETRYSSAFFAVALSKYMYEHIRDDLGLCYGVSMSRLQHLDNSYNLIAMLTNNNYLEKAEIELNKLFDKVKSEGFPQEIFEISKKQLTYSQVKVLDSVRGVSAYVVSGINGSANRTWFLEEGFKILDPDWLKNSAAQLTQDNLREFANIWLDGFSKFAMVSTKAK